MILYNILVLVSLLVFGTENEGCSRRFDALGCRPADLAVWTELAKLPTAAKQIDEAAELIDSPVPDCPDEFYLDFTRNGNRTRYQKPYFERLHTLTAFMKAEMLERKGRFLAPMARFLDAICAERTWVMPAHDRKLNCFNGALWIDLGVAHRATAVGIAIGWFGDRLPAATVAKARSELNRRVFEPYLWTLHNKVNSRYFGSWHVSSNWNAVCNGGVVIAALTALEDGVIRREIVQGWYEAMPYYLRGFTPDGYCSEGIGYWNYGYGAFIEAALIVKAMTDGTVNAFELPRARKAMEYGYGFQVEYMRSAQFADGSGNPAPRILALAELVWPDLASTAGRSMDRLGGNLTTVIARNFTGGKVLPPPEKVGALSLDNLPVRSWFPDAQVLISRDGNAKKPFGVAIKGGHNKEHHNHNDLGSYTLMLGGVTLAGDAGGEVYTARTFSPQRYEGKVLSSYGHPVPRPGLLQAEGKQYAAKVVSTDFTDEKDTLVLDLSKAYATSNIVALTRAFVFNRVKGTLTVTDKVAFAEPSAFDSPIITTADVIADYEKGKFDLRSGHAAVAVTAKASGGDWKLSTELVENPLKVSPKRLSIEFTAPVKSAETTWTFRAKGKRL